MKRILIVIMALLTVMLCMTSCNSKGTVSKDNNYSYREEIGGVQEKPLETLENDQLSSGQTSESDRLLVRTYALNLETKNFSDCVTLIETKTAEYKGYIESSKVNGSSIDSKVTNVRSASYVVRIPADGADAFIDSLGDMVNIVSRQSSAEDVTQSNYELKAQLASLKLQEERVLAMLEKAEDLSSMLQLEDKLSDLRTRIQSLESQLNGLENRVTYATINMSVTEVIEYTDPVLVREQTFNEKISKAFKESWTDFGEGCQSFAVWLVEALPTLIVLAVIAGVCILVIRSSIRRNRKKAEERRNAYYAAVQQRKDQQDPPPASPSAGS